MTASPNVAASVKQRLLNLAKKRGVEFNRLLTWYGIERLLYRLSRTSHERQFVLKGAMLFHTWRDEPHRPTRDVDLLGIGAPDWRVSRSVTGNGAGAGLREDVVAAGRTMAGHSGARQVEQQLLTATAAGCCSACGAISWNDFRDPSSAYYAITLAGRSRRKRCPGGAANR